VFWGGGDSPAIMGQDKHQIIGEYYGDVQMLSARAALYQMITAAGADFTRLIFVGKGHDMLHVNLVGHRWYADLIISYLRGVTTELVARQVAAEALGGEGGALVVTGAQAVLAGGAHPHQESGPAPGCSKIQGRRGKAFPQNCTANGLRPPFYKGNEVQDLGVCAIGTDFVGVVKSHEQWDWVDEGRNGVHKWGFVSTTVGAQLVVEVDMTMRKPGSKSKGDRQHVDEMLAWLIYLGSYTGMGTAKLTCSGGCKCKEATIDAMSKDKRIKASVPQLFEFTLRSVPAGGDTCVLTVELLEAMSPPVVEGGSNTRGHKFKVIGITTSPQPVWHLADIVVRGNNAWVDDD